MSSNPNATQYDVTVNAEGVYAALAKATNSFDKFGLAVAEKTRRAKVAQDALTEAVSNGAATTLRAQRQATSFMEALQQEAANAGKTRAELLSLKAAQLGVADSAKQYIAQIEKAKKAAAGGGHGGGHGGVNAGISREFMVMAHETAMGSWKNLGGSAMVMAEQLNVLKYVLTPIGGTLLAVAAAAGLAALAFYQGTQQTEAINRSIKLTGDYAGTTAGQMVALADSMKDIKGRGDAFSAVEAVVGSGRIQQGAVEAATKAVLDYGKATGETAADSAKALGPMFEDPVAGAVKLNETMHFLTSTQYEQMKAMQDAGDKAGAQKIAFEALDASVKVNAENAGWLARAWHGVAGAFKSAWSAMQDLGRATTKQDAYVAAVDKLKSFDNYNKLADPEGFKKAQARVRETAAAMTKEANDAKDKALSDELNQDKIGADKAVESIRSNAEKRAAAQENAGKKYAATMARINASTLSEADKAESIRKAAAIRDATIAKAEHDYKDPKQAKAKVAPGLTVNDTMLESLNKQNEALKEQITTGEKVTAARKAQLDVIAKLAELDEKYARNPKSLTAQESKMRGDRQALTDAAALGVSLQDQADKQGAINKLKERAKQIDADILNYQKQQSEQYAAQLEAVGKGAKEQQRVAAERSIRNKYLQEQAKLDKETPESARSDPKYLEATKGIAAAQQNSLDMSRDYYAQMDALQQSWVLGFSEAWANYVDTAMNSMQQAATVFGAVTNGMQDMFTQFCETGKLSFASMTKSILADLAKIAMQKAIMGFGASLLSFGMGAMAANTGAAATMSNMMPGDSLDNMMSVTGGFGTALAHADGGHITGPGTGTSDSIPAWLSNGEYVLTAQTVRRLGVANLDKLNSGAAIHNTAHFATGGAVGNVAAQSSGGVQSSGASVNIAFHGDNGGLDKSDTAYLGKAIKAIVDTRIAQKMKGQGGYAWQMNNGVLT